VRPCGLNLRPWPAVGSRYLPSFSLRPTHVAFFFFPLPFLLSSFSKLCGRTEYEVCSRQSLTSALSSASRAVSYRSLCRSLSSASTADYHSLSLSSGSRAVSYRSLCRPLVRPYSGLLSFSLLLSRPPPERSLIVLFVALSSASRAVSYRCHCRSLSSAYRAVSCRSHSLVHLQSGLLSFSLSLSLVHLQSGLYNPPVCFSSCLFRWSSAPAPSFSLLGGPVPRVATLSGPVCLTRSSSC